MDTSLPTRLAIGDRVDLLVIEAEQTDDPRWPTVGLGTVGHIERIDVPGADDAEYVEGPVPGLIVTLDALRAAWSIGSNGTSVFTLRPLSRELTEAQDAATTAADRIEAIRRGVREVEARHDSTQARVASGASGRATPSGRHREGTGRTGAQRACGGE